MLVAPPGSAPRVRATAKPHPHPQVWVGFNPPPSRSTVPADCARVCARPVPNSCHFSSALTIGPASSERERPQPPAIGGDVDARGSAPPDLEKDQRHPAPPPPRP